MNSPISLGRLKPGARGRIASLRADGGPVALLTRLMEMGFLEGSEIEVLHEAPFGRDPIAVRVRGTVVALRRQEADWIWVDVAPGAAE
jgi:ferrous iron transport protein A